MFQNFLNNNNIKHYSRFTHLGGIFVERFNRTLRNLLRKLVFEKGDSNWVDFLSIVTKHYDNKIHSSTKLTPIEASLKKNEGYVYPNLLDKRKKNKTKI